jgi:ATP-dependent DNA helicase RecG
MLIEQTPLDRLLGDRTARALKKHFGYTTAGELLEHYPRRYSHRGELTPLGSVPLGEPVTVVAEVVSVADRRMRGRSGSILEVTVTDGSATLVLAFFNQAWRRNELKPGSRGLFSGKIASYRNQLQLAHPDYELFQDEIDPEQAAAWAELPIPIYPAVAAMTTWKLQRAIEVVLQAVDSLPELLDAQLLADSGLISLREALRKVHQPERDVDWQRARDSLRFHEAMMLQLELLSRRAELAKTSSSKHTPGELLSGFDSQLPFQLTGGQIAVGRQIESDLAAGNPMHRLLQGEVGSGKTVVALRAVLTVAQSGGQSAVLAPTEVLAQQHYQSMLELLGPDLTKQLGVRLLTGQTATAERKRVLLDLVSGKARLVIGTHALLSEGVEFYDLALVVIDEQHRFGVGQRETLRAKGKTAPHTLVMTATPIPRTLAITVFGDLEISALRELPAGRKEIATHVVAFTDAKLLARVWQRVAEEVGHGRQAFVVCPRIEGEDYEPDTQLETDELLTAAGSELAPPAAATEIASALAQNPALSKLRIGLLHGRLPAEEKQRVMAAFAAGDIDLLVATTVIEVGVNVPNASVMVVLDADRFGLSQLHQLRGRVGRGEHPGLCLLVSASEQDSLAMRRLEALASTTDGFELSELDLEIRGEGDVLGSLQSGGRSSLKLLRVVRDQDLIQQSRVAAEKLLPELTPTLKAALELQRLAAISES